MRSKAHLRGHPIHPALIPFPLAFLAGGFLFDLAGVLADRPLWWAIGGHLLLAGIATALIAAVPGLIDYLFTVPPQSSGKRRATLHMASNLGAVTGFGVALLLRGGLSAEPAVPLLLLGAVGLGLLSVGGWMGGTLVSRNQISVDHRYARAGKWHDESLSSGDGPVVVARAGELEVDQMKLIRLDGRRIVVARTADGYVAFDDRCTHRGGSLAGGVMMCGTVQCPWHGSQFDVRTGKVQSGPARSPIRPFELEESNGEVRLLPARKTRRATAGKT